jgi:4-hydroxy-tetrahydrodipicolinate synthase
VIAIKEAAGNVETITEMSIALGQVGLENVAVLTGEDHGFAPALISGASGVISVTTHFIPKTMLGIWNAHQKKDAYTMGALHLSCYEINQGLFRVPNPVGVKWILSQMNLCENVLRPPLYPVDEAEALLLQNIFQKSFQIEER